jgi:hypothetical protein
MQWRLSKKQISSMMTVVVVLAGLASAQAATGNDQKSGAAVSPAGKTLLQGTVTGGGTDDVTVFWGPADGGMTPANWAHQQVLKDVKSDTPFSITAEPVVYGLTYYYRCQISGGGTAVWAEASTTFTGSKPRVAATGANNAPALPVTSSLACWYDAAVGVTYGRLLTRTTQARLTHGIRGAFWHQSENDQESQGASGGYGWENYQKHFTNMTANWKQDYPNIQHYYIFQIWPNSCQMGGTKHSDKLRDVQRLLPRLYSNMSIMSTLGIKPEGPCHYPPAGYAVMAQMVAPLVEHYNYGKTFDKPITPPDLQKASYSSANKDEITLVFDQPMVWENAQASQFHLDGMDGQVVSGEVSGNVLKLKLKAASEAKEITYVTDKNWDWGKLLMGKNGIASLTFAEVNLTPVEK